MRRLPSIASLLPAIPILALTLVLILPAPAFGDDPSGGRPRGEKPTTCDVLLHGGRVVDGTGNPWLAADVCLANDRIAGVGPAGRFFSKRTIDVRGLVVAPGFIDMLGQSEYTVLVDSRVPSKITQGITTELTGEGASVAPMTPFLVEEMKPYLSDLKLEVDWEDFDGYFKRLSSKGTAINFAHLVGAAQVRAAILKSENRAPSAAELEKMKQAVARAMEQGAFGLSSSLIYPPGTFASTAELIELAKVASSHGGFYATHMRNESGRILEAIEEAVSIGEQAHLPVEIWHLKTAGRANWGKMGVILQAIEAARDRGVEITADIYPYSAAATDLSATLPPKASEGGIHALVTRLKDPAERARIRKEMEAPAEAWENLLSHAGGPEGVLVAGVRTEANKIYQGKRVSEIAAMRGKDPIETIFDLLVEEDGTVDAIYFIMSEEDVRLAAAAPFVSFDCDAPGVQPQGLLGARMIHPRAYGSFPRVLGRFVREEKGLGLEDAVRKMTSLPASRLGLPDRGLLRAGYQADVTVFDPKTIVDRATFESPHRFSEGVVHVFVNGEAVVENGRITGKLPGRILRGPGYRG